MRNFPLQALLPGFGKPEFPKMVIVCQFFFIPLLLVSTGVVGETALSNETASRHMTIAKNEASKQSEAFTLYKEMAEQGDVEAQFNVGVMCETGWSVPLDNKKAVRWYREAANQGHADAQIRLGMMYYLGIGARQSDIKGQKWIRKAAKQNHVLASNLYKRIFSDDVPDALLPTPAIKRVRDAYLKNEKQALRVLDNIVQEAKQQDVRAEKKKEESSIRERRVQRITEGPVKPGFGASVEVEKIKSVVPGFIGDASLEENRTLARGSVATIRLQAEKGIASAEYNLGRMYELGIKLPVDKQRALTWYTKSANQGYANAEYRLGVATLYGAGVQQDDVQGKRWLKLAAQHGHAVAKKMIESMRSELGSQNISLAVNWYFERALAGDAESSFHLGKLYQFGWGVEVDNFEAIKWYRRADSLNFQEAGVSLRKLELKMSKQKEKVAPEKSSKKTGLEGVLEKFNLPVWLAHPGVIVAVALMLLWLVFFRKGLRRSTNKEQEEIQEI